MSILNTETEEKIKVGVFGGTFNPIHNGHIALAEQLLVCAHLDLVLFMVSARPPHKSEEILSPEVRLKMVELALEGKENMLPCDLELKREGKSYTLHTMRELREKHPEWELSFVTGADMFVSIPFWYEPTLLFKENKFLVADRENAFETAEYEVKVQDILKKYQPDVDFIHTHTPFVSSCAIRENIEKNKPFLPEAVYEYIKRNELYE